MITASELRNIIAIIPCIDRHEIEAVAGPITDKAWAYFWNDPYRGFLSFGGHLQDSIARIVSERLSPITPEATVTGDTEAAFAEIERLRMATNEGTLAKRADRMWEIACEMQGRPVPGAALFTPSLTGDTPVPTSLRTAEMGERAE